MEKQIKEIMDNFDFEKVHKVMEFLRWEWYAEGVPSIESLKKCAERLLRQAVNDKDLTEISTGGFMVLKNNHKLELLFSIEDYHSEI